jgi:hypothetical protein
MRDDRRPLPPRLWWRALAFAGVLVGGGLGVGWQRPPAPEDVAAIVRTRFNFLVSDGVTQAAKAEGREPTGEELQALSEALVALEAAEVRLGPLRRDWPNELLSSKGSRWMVEASLVPNDALPEAERWCFHVEHPLAVLPVVYDRGPGPCGLLGW